MDALGFFPWFGLYVLMPLVLITLAVMGIIALTDRRAAGATAAPARRTRGKVVIVGLGAFAIAFGATLWWVQTHAWYDEVSGLTAVTVEDREVPVAGYAGLDGASPLKLRGCFTLDPAEMDGVAPATDATPLVAPDWFGCFDAARLTEDLEAGRATAYLAGVNHPQDFERIIAVYPDGRAFMWRQLNEKYRD